jgi:hypothetical protein
MKGWWTYRRDAHQVVNGWQRTRMAFEVAGSTPARSTISNSLILKI